MTSQIEKIARLIGLNISRVDDTGNVFIHGRVSGEWHFNPLTNKVDLMDVECALGIDVQWINNEFVHANSWVGEELISSNAVYADHPDKFTARAAAVCAVAEQIYDKGQV